jgi:Right handed beta helix region
VERHEKKKLKLFPSESVHCLQHYSMLVHWCIDWLTVLLLLTAVQALQKCEQLKKLHFDVLTVQDAAELAAAAVYSGNAFTATWNGAKILSETITVGSNTTLTIRAASGNLFNAAATIDGNSTTQLFIVYGNLTIINLTLQHGFSSTQGGAINVLPSAFVALKNCTLKGHRASNGAAIFNTRGTLQIDDSTFSSNAVDISSPEDLSGSIHATEAVVSISSSVFMNEPNSAVYATDRSTVTVSNSTFSNNLATLGAALTCQNSTTAYVSGCLFDSNHAQLAGAIAIITQSQLVASDTVFRSCTADVAGGAVGISDAISAEFTNVSIDSIYKQRNFCAIIFMISYVFRHILLYT